ncbi:MAG: helix-hairpin-helix domain-containing protein [Phaeodactylibacter xiamenensis]|jgi:predicted flap endonuclease-1-like 5' DNA nuclease|uniref:helix-hairpin-helix domain-containing protein n=1 Tax=Phaeodactylibacter xiamenensis TaxID=1524460 RepID=UPI0006973DAB|nr:helix-hairpin-helix domain-containing protein [Phaeodactylibacter xiamenensis]MCR9051686.1 helix-hairpin-helix domain-containing protein [bacterium]
MEFGTLFLATLEPCWLWWLILSALAFILGAIVGCLLCGNKKKLRELEVDNAALQARSTNWEKDYMGLKYQHEQLEGTLKEIRAKLNSCEADKRILESKLAQAGEGEGRVELSTGPTLVVAMGRSSNPDDLTKIEGIGPKIEGLLNAGGIYTWKELANTTVERLQEILDEAGKRFGLAKPDSWPRQAALAAAGEWEALQKLQDELQGGIDKS